MADNKSRPTSFSQLAVTQSATGERLQALSLHALRLNRIEKQIQKFLPGETRKKVRVANYTYGRLVLEAHSKKEVLLLSAGKNALIEKLTPILKGLHEIVFIVSGGTGVTQKTAIKRTLSHESADMLEWVATLSPEGLSEALKRLARYRS